MIQVGHSQLHCETVQLILEEQGENVFTFDDFSSYEGGIARTTVARLKVRVEDKAVSDGLCSWSLYMSLDNNGAPTNEWEELNLYSNGLASNPLTSLLEIRITNDCATSNLDGTFTNFTDVSAVNIKEIIEPIILDALNINHPGACGTKNVNGPGDYISNYQEFTFKIEVRIKPGMAYNPGRFGLTINFRLEENI
ncbi:hypothetical protein ACFLRU_03330 [Bacteroidota bacterium]